MCSQAWRPEFDPNTHVKKPGQEQCTPVPPGRERWEHRQSDPESLLPNQSGSVNSMFSEWPCPKMYLEIIEENHHGGSF